ncbi:hypothetical protein B7C62_02580 [Kitasatospora albolonga]|uniref:Transposase n=1 Tax=Kitasatospora albolonga TaxID=68173 RepID=A0ABC8BLJ8_9ACTN|nr:hypothetical protein B7C62_02580 [Kitasatospora albolonga]
MAIMPGPTAVERAGSREGQPSSTSRTRLFSPATHRRALAHNLTGLINRLVYSDTTRMRT